MSDPVRPFRLLAIVTGTLALIVGGQAMLQASGAPVPWRVQPGVIPVCFVAAGFWGLVTVALLLGGRLARRTVPPPGPPGPRGGQPVLPFRPRGGRRSGRRRAA